MTTTPTVEEFLAQQDPDEEPEHVPPPRIEWTVDKSDPLESIAESLQAIAGAVTESRETDQRADDLAARETELQRERDELEKLHDAKQQLIEDTLKICEKSTSKLANSIRALLEPVVTTEEPEPATVPVENATEMGLQQPDHDAPVEEWRAYARQLGHGRTGPSFNELEQMNRSQIRTMLGIEHGGGE